MKFRKVKELLENIKWKLRKIDMKLMRRKLEKSNFYEDVLFTDGLVKNRTQKYVADWMFGLKKYRKIEIKKFKDLFKNFDEIVFPIEIKYYGSIGTNIIDSNGEKYYLYNKNIYDYYKMIEYYIGKRSTLSEPPVDQEHCYRICEGETIELVEMTVLKLGQDGSNSDIGCKISYHTNIEVITMYSNDKEIKIEYPIRDNGFRKETIEYLWECIEMKWYFYDVFPVLKWIVSTFEEDTSIHIVSEDAQEVLSEIKIEKGIVKKYTVTQIINEGEMHITQKIFARKLKEFLLEMTL